MAKLTAEQRNKLKDEDFVFPESRKFPIHDRARAISALSRAQQNLDAEGNRKVRQAVCARHPNLPACSTKQYSSPL